MTIDESAQGGNAGQKYSQEPQADSCAGRRSRRRHHGHRKERVLHTRISEQLSDDIRRLADDLRLPVSNLVRSVLEEVFTVVEIVSDDVGEFFEDVVDEADGIRERIRNQHRTARATTREARRERSRRRRTRPADVEDELVADENTEARESGRDSTQPSATEDPHSEWSDVLGWQPIVLNQQVACSRCSASLKPGASAMIAILPTRGTGQVVCPGCAAKA